MEKVLSDTAELAKAAVGIASDKKASDVLLLDIRDVSVIADYFVICSGNNNRQFQAIADAIDEGSACRRCRIFTYRHIQLLARSAVRHLATRTVRRSWTVRKERSRIDAEWELLAPVWTTRHR